MSMIRPTEKTSASTSSGQKNSHSTTSEKILRIWVSEACISRAKKARTTKSHLSEPVVVRYVFAVDVIEKQVFLKELKECSSVKTYPIVDCRTTYCRNRIISATLTSSWWDRGAWVKACNDAPHGEFSLSLSPQEPCRGLSVAEFILSTVPHN